MTIRAIVRFPSSTSRLPFPLTSLTVKSRMFSSDKYPPCTCRLSIDTIQTCLTEGNRNTLGLEMANCHKAMRYKRDWETYRVELAGRSEAISCKATQVFSDSLYMALLKKENIKAIDTKSFLLESHLSILSSEPGEITLAGEGRRLVGRKNYWETILSHLRKYKHLPTCILSIGGAQGYDALAIAGVLKSEGFTVRKPLVIDPNRLAAFLAEDEIDYYVMTSQRFFDKHFVRQEGVLYIIHLGTTLNVVKEEVVVQILTQISKKMTSNDVLSLIVVSKNQFNRRNYLRFGEENEQGISKVIYLKTGQHYKTVITNSEKFIQFMQSLELEGDIVDVVEKGKIITVAFVVYKAIKKTN